MRGERREERGERREETRERRVRERRVEGTQTGHTEAERHRHTDKQSEATARLTRDSSLSSPHDRFLSAEGVPEGASEVMRRPFFRSSSRSVPGAKGVARLETTPNDRETAR